MLQCPFKASQPLVITFYWIVRQRQILPLQSYAARRPHAPLSNSQIIQPAVLGAAIRAQEPNVSQKRDPHHEGAEADFDWRHCS